jgi:hypothetical protein
MNTSDIYRQAIKRTFANLYSVARQEVDVSWNEDGDNITVRCAGALEFVSTHEDPVTIRLTNDERLRLERTDLDRLNGF